MSKPIKYIIDIFKTEKADPDNQREYPMENDTASLLDNANTHADNAQTILSPNDAMEIANEAATKSAKAEKEASEAISEYICMIDNKYRKVKKTGRTASLTKYPAVEPLIEIKVLGESADTDPFTWALESSLYRIHEAHRKQPKWRRDPAGAYVNTQKRINNEL